MRCVFLFLVAALQIWQCLAALSAVGEFQLGEFAQQKTSLCSAQGSDYFNTAMNACGSCGTNQMADTSLVNALGDPVACKCAAGYKKNQGSCTGTTTGTCAAFTCVACSASNAPTRDQKDCLPCADGKTGTFTSGTATSCSCASTNGQYTQYLVETTSKITCEECPPGRLVIASAQIIAGKAYKADLYSCQACPDPYTMVMTYSSGVYSCVPIDTTLMSMFGDASGAIGPQQAVYNDMATAYLGVESSAVQVKYAAVTVESLTFKHYFTASAARCNNYGSPADAKACQALANLCVLTLYNPSSGACAAFNAIVTARGTSYTNSVLNWAYNLPWLTFANGIAACSDTSYRVGVSLSKFVMKYVVAQYGTDGTFYGFTELGSILNYCTRRAPYTSQGGGTSSSTGWQNFGAAETTTYACDLDTLSAASGAVQMFYELYLYDPKWPSSYYPVPVRIVGPGSGSATVLRPRGVCDITDTLVRRFFLFDIVSGLTTASPTVPQVMRYAADIFLEVQISTGSFSQINSPVLTINYKESVPSSWTAYDPGLTTGPATSGSQTVKYNWEARYTMDMTAFNTNLYNFFIALVVFFGLGFLFRLRNWNIRHSRLAQLGMVNTGINLKLVVESVVLGTSTWVYFFFPVQVIICWYFFVFFKLQSVPATLLPQMYGQWTVGNPYFVFVANLHVMAFFQFFYCLVLIYRQSSVDIFFLDWQPPPVVSSSGTSKGQPRPSGKVSVWRTLFVANEWGKLMTKRKTSLAFSLFWIVFFLLGLNEEYEATQQPYSTDKTPGKLNIVLRFANTTWWWIVVSAFQYLWNFLFWERCVSESPEQQFVDLCTIAKVSILVLDEQYHGYYLHCRSPHQNADSTMAELVEMLHKEEAGLTVDRSLEGGPKDVQTFQIFMSADWRSNFEKYYSKLSKSAGLLDYLLGGGSRGAGRGLGRGGQAATPLRLGAGPDSSVQDPRSLTSAFLRVTSFLQEFVENSLNSPGLRRVIREATYQERFLHVPPEMGLGEQPCVFLPDRHFHYSKVLFYGRELDLLLMNVLAYSLFDVWFGSTATSVLLTFLLDFSFGFLRRRLGMANIANKTLIDPRFLI